MGEEQIQRSALSLNRRYLAEEVDYGGGELLDYMDIYFVQV